MINRSKILALLLALSFIVVLSGVALQQAEETVTCPACGIEIKKSEAKVTYEYEGKTYYFCCKKCKEEFIKNPEKYIEKKAEMKKMKDMHAHMKMHKKSEKKPCCPMMDLMSSKDIEMNVENLEDGIAVKITSKNAETVKKIQEMSVKMKEMCKKKTVYKKEVKKEEAKKEEVKK